MRFLLMSDVHVDERQPINRTEDIEKAQGLKLKQVFEIGVKANCEAILQAGDLTNRPTIASRTVSRLLRLAYSHCIPLYCVAGQHDLLFRNFENIEDTALGVLHNSGLYNIIPPGISVGFEGVTVYGCHWGGDIPYPADTKRHNILVVHSPVGDKLFADHKITPANVFLKQHKFDLILVGDYHYPFMHQVENVKTGKKRTIVNTGVLLRRKIDEEEIEPRVAIYDTEDRSVSWQFIDHTHNVFKPRKEAVDDGVEDLVQEVLANIKRAKTMSSDYKESVLKFVEELEDIDKGVKDMVFKILDEAEEAVNA